jgi:hypothetical protein
VTKLHGINSRDLHRKEIYAQDEISYLVRNPKMEYYVIIYNLKNNKNLNDNEDLIRFVALTNEGLFRELQNRKNEFSLIDTSFLKLPQDIKISYAMDNFSKVITTGEYVDIKNKKKSFNAKSIYPNLDFKYTNNSKKMEIIKFEELENKLIKYNEEFVLVDRDVAQLYGVETREINQAVLNNLDKFPEGYIVELKNEEKIELIKKFDRFNKLKHSTVNPKVFTEKGLYMLATIIKSKVATQTTIKIIETFAKVKELSRNINDIMKTDDENIQKNLASKSNKILEDIIEIEDEILSNDEDGEVIETTTKFEFNLGFAKVSRSIKKIKK